METADLPEPTLQHVKAPPKPKRRWTLCGMSKASAARAYVSPTLSEAQAVAALYEYRRVCNACIMAEHAAKEVG